MEDQTFIDAVLEALVTAQAEGYRRFDDAEIVHVEDPADTGSDVEGVGGKEEYP